MKSRAAFAVVMMGVILGAGCSGPAEPEAPASGAGSPFGKIAFKLPAGLEGAPLVIPADNPITAGKSALGEQLFFDPRLSGSGKMSCESCHHPEIGWHDALKMSPKDNGSLNKRHTPTIMGAGFYPELYWDGRAQGLEAQILAAWKGQMGGDTGVVATALNGIDEYRSQFQAEFGGPATEKNIVQALGSFVRTVHAGDTPWDRLSQDPAAMESTPEGRGFKVFSEVARCALCHAPPMYTDLDFHNVGIGFDGPDPDPGRAGYLKKAAEAAGRPAPPEAETLMGAFKTPSLRGVALTGPYFHDGRAATLEEAVDLMLAGGIANPHLDARLKKVELTAKQRSDLLAFLKALTPDTSRFGRPELP